MEDYERNKKAKKEVKKIVRNTKSKAYCDLYTKLGAREREKILCLRNMKKESRDSDYAKSIKSNDQKVLAKDNDLKSSGEHILSYLLVEIL